MMRFCYIILAACVLAACSHGKKGGTGEQQTIIPQDKMKLVLFDVLRAQEYAATKYGKDTVAVNAGMAVMLKQVFAIHKVSKGDFYNSFRWYEAHPDENEVLFDSLSAYTDKKRQDLFKNYGRLPPSRAN